MKTINTAIGAAIFSLNAAFAGAGSLFDAPPSAPQPPAASDCRGGGYSRDVRDLANAIAVKPVSAWGQDIKVGLRMLGRCGVESLTKVLERHIENETREGVRALSAVEAAAKGDERAADRLRKTVTDHKIRQALDSYHKFLLGDNGAFTRDQAKSAIEVRGVEKKTEVMKAIQDGVAGQPAGTAPAPVM